MMKYQIIGTGENDTSIVFWTYDDLKIATKMFNFLTEMSKHGSVNLLLKLPLLKSIELQQIETISQVQIEQEPE